MNTPANSDKRPLEVEIVRPLTVGGAVGGLFASIAALALPAWGFDILIAQLFPAFEISFWQIVAAIIFTRHAFSRTFQPRTVAR